MLQSKTKDKKKRFTLDMSPDLQKRIKIAAASKGITMREYSLSAIVDRLNRDELQTVVPGHFSQESVKKARDLQKRIFGSRRLADESVELIRQSRKERTEQLDRL